MNGIREAIVVGFKKLTSLDSLEALIVKDCKTDVVFEIDCGYNSADRDFIWQNRSRLKGNIIKYKQSQDNYVWMGFW